MLAASYNVVLAAALSAQLYGTTGVNIDTGSGTQTVRIGHNGTIGTPGSGTESWKVTVDGSTTSELHVSGTNKLLSTDGAQATSSSGATVDLYSHTCATGETIRVTAELHAARTDSGTNKAVRIISAAFKNIAGTVTDGTPENIRAPDNLGTAWGTPPSVTFSHSGTNILITGAAAGATDTRFNITEIKWFVSTTSA
jgi:hypothetical protein